MQDPSLTDDAWVEYGNEMLTVEIPRYLKQTRKALLFEVPSSYQNAPCLTVVAVNVLNSPELASGVRDSITSVKAFDWGDLEREIVRQSELPGFQESADVVIRQVNKVTKEAIFNRELIFKKDGLMIHMRIVGRGNFTESERSCDRIIGSIRLR
jgi:hypothetical protein